MNNMCRLLHPKVMNLKAPVTLLVAFALLGQSTGMAAPRPLELKWSELSSTIRGRTIKLTLPEGATVSGEVIVVREESMVVNVRKASDSKGYPKGNATIPRKSVTVLSMTESNGRWGRKIGSGLGTLSGVLAGGYVAAKTANSGGSGLAIFGMITGAATLGGYFIGRSADAKATLIRVVP
jgi:hypothetical protein